MISANRPLPTRTDGRVGGTANHLTRLAIVIFLCMEIIPKIFRDSNDNLTRPQHLHNSDISILFFYCLLKRTCLLAIRRVLLDSDEGHSESHLLKEHRRNTKDRETDIFQSFQYTDN